MDERTAQDSQFQDKQRIDATADVTIYALQHFDVMPQNSMMSSCIAFNLVKSDLRRALSKAYPDHAFVSRNRTIAEPRSPVGMTDKQRAAIVRFLRMDLAA